MRDRLVRVTLHFRIDVAAVLALLLALASCQP